MRREFEGGWANIGQEQHNSCFRLKLFRLPSNFENDLDSVDVGVNSESVEGGPQSASVASEDRWRTTAVLPGGIRRKGEWEDLLQYDYGNLRQAYCFCVEVHFCGSVSTMKRIVMLIAKNTIVVYLTISIMKITDWFTMIYLNIIEVSLPVIRFDVLFSLLSLEKLAHVNEYHASSLAVSENL